MPIFSFEDYHKKKKDDDEKRKKQLPSQKAADEVKKIDEPEGSFSFESYHQKRAAERPKAEQKPQEVQPIEEPEKEKGFLQKSIDFVKNFLNKEEISGPLSDELNSAIKKLETQETELKSENPFLDELGEVKSSITSANLTDEGIKYIGDFYAKRSETKEDRLINAKQQVGNIEIQLKAVDSLIEVRPDLAPSKKFLEQKRDLYNEFINNPVGDPDEYVEVNLDRKELPEEYSEPGFFGQLADAFLQGTYSMLSSSSSQIESLGAQGLGGPAEFVVSEFGTRSRIRFERELKEHPEWERPTDIGKWEDPDYYARIVGEGIPSILGSVAIGVGTAVLTGGSSIAALGASFTYSFLSEGGSSYQAAVDYGLSKEDAEFSGNLVGAINGAIEIIPVFGWISGKIGKKATKELTGEIGESIIKKVIREVKKKGFDSFKNFLEEASQESTQSLIDNAIAMSYDEDRGIWDGVLESFVAGGILGGLSGLVKSDVSEAISPIKETDAKQQEEKETTPIKREKISVTDKYEGAETAYANIRPDGTAAISVKLKEEAQGSGLGTKVVKDLETQLIEKGIKTVELSSFEESVGFWEKQGYKTTGEKTGLNVKMVKELDTKAEVSKQVLKDTNKPLSTKNTRRVIKETKAGKREDFRLSSAENIKKYSQGFGDAKPTDTIIVHRAGDTDLKANQYVTTSEERANTVYLKERPRSKLISQEVKISDLVHGGGLKSEFVYSPKAEVGPRKIEGAKPIAAYHGTDQDFTVFDSSKIGTNTDSGMFGKGFYFSSSKKEASTYARKTGSVKEVSLNLKNPLIINSKKDIPKIESISTKDYSEKFTKIVKEMGHDGVIDNISKNKQYIVFDPSLIEIKQKPKVSPQQELRNYYAEQDQEAVGQAWFEVMAELEIAEAGTRIYDKDGNTTGGISSTFPQWVTPELRTRKIFNSVFKDISDPSKMTFPPNSQPRKQALYEEILSEIDSRAGTDSSNIIEGIKNVKEEKKVKQVAKTSVEGDGRGKGKPGDRRTLTLDTLIKEARTYSKADEFDSTLFRENRTEEVEALLKKEYPDIGYLQALEEVIKGRKPKVPIDYTKGPIEVLHGTDATFDLFDADKANTGSGTGVKKGHIFFTDNKSVAESYGKNIVKRKISFKNPLVVDAKSSDWGSIEYNDKNYDINQLAILAEEKGHDGLVVEHVRDTGGKTADDVPAGFTESTTYAIFDQKSIVKKKKAITKPEDKSLEKPPKGFKESKVIKRVKDLLEAEVDLSETIYKTVGLDTISENAIDLVNNKPDLAKDIISGFAPVPDNTTKAGIMIAAAEMARKAGDYKTQKDLVIQRSFMQTKHGREIVTEKLVNSLSSDRFIREVLKVRMSKIVKRTKKGITVARAFNEKVVSNSKGATRKVNRKVLSKIASAQQIIDDLIC